jgi:single-stranded-DNA-specific exonuclease
LSSPTFFLLSSFSSCYDSLMPVLENVLNYKAPVTWAVRPIAPPQAVAKLCREFSVPPILASVLWARGLGGEALGHLQPPLTLTQIPDLDAAAERLELAIKNKKRILIHGDYDADGISGTAVLTLGLRALGANVTPFIPNRLTDGYGIHPDRVPEHAERADLFLTVDCGITNLKEIKALQDAGVEVILSDHHQPASELPKCLLVHPKMSPLAKKGLPELTGSGVAFHLLWALHQRLGLEAPLEYADLATLGVIADVAPLMGENRALVQVGLARMANSQWVGLRAAIAQSRLNGPPTARDVAFIIAPRLNAAGRLGEADAGLELLTTASERRARELAVYLDARNSERRKIQDEMFNIAIEKVDLDAPALVLDHVGWHAGVMGIVASHLLERFYKPVYIIAQGKGSVRSTPGISAVDGLHKASHLLKRYGGHTQAAGFSMPEENVQAFRKIICDYVAEHPKPQRVIVADSLLSSADIDDDLYKSICELEPYGEGHPSPLFALTDTLDMAKAVGQNGNTLQLRIGGVKGVAWQKGEQATRFQSGQTVNAVVSLRENIWQEKRNLEFVAEDIRTFEALGFASETENVPLENLTPDLKLPTVFRGQPETLTSETVCLKELPLDASLLSLTDSLNNLKHSVLYFDLDTRALIAIEKTIADLPKLHDVRRGFVALQKGLVLPFGEHKNALVKKILQELELLDQHGQVLRAQKRDPYSSETLLKALIERYKLESFIKAYKYLDDVSFAKTVHELFFV